MPLPKPHTPESWFMFRPYDLHFYYVEESLGADMEIAHVLIERHLMDGNYQYTATYTDTDGRRFEILMKGLNSTELASKIHRRWPQARIERKLNCDCHPQIQQLWPRVAAA